MSPSLQGATASSRIRSVSAHRLEARLSRGACLVEITAEDGVVGWGEAFGPALIAQGLPPRSCVAALLAAAAELGVIIVPSGVNLSAACTVARISLDQIVRHLTDAPPISLAWHDMIHSSP